MWSFIHAEINVNQCYLRDPWRRSVYHHPAFARGGSWREESDMHVLPIDHKLGNDWDHCSKWVPIRLCWPYGIDKTDLAKWCGKSCWLVNWYTSYLMDSNELDGPTIGLVRIAIIQLPLYLAQYIVFTGTWYVYLLGMLDILLTNAFSIKFFYGNYDSALYTKVIHPVCNH